MLARAREAKVVPGLLVNVVTGTPVYICHREPPGLAIPPSRPQLVTLVRANNHINRVLKKSSHLATATRTDFEKDIQEPAEQQLNGREALLPIYYSPNVESAGRRGKLVENDGAEKVR